MVGDSPTARRNAAPGADDRGAALELLVQKYFPHLAQGVDYAEPSADELARTAVYRIDIEEWSGKQKVGEPGHPGAFAWGKPPEPVR